MARKRFDMVDVVEILTRWEAGKGAFDGVAGPPWRPEAETTTVYAVADPLSARVPEIGSR
ncbi:hypothetical protein GCM10020216_031470 [Nonomuraea helvata]